LEDYRKLVPVVDEDRVLHNDILQTDAFIRSL
jgi:histidine ammonia-lyase